jgi:hypothetical protein
MAGAHRASMLFPLPEDLTGRQIGRFIVHHSSVPAESNAEARRASRSMFVEIAAEVSIPRVSLEAKVTDC